MVDPVLVAKAAVTLLSNEKTRKGIGWAIAAILSPFIVVVALLCSLGSGAASHNISAAQLCFQDGTLPDNTPAEYRVCIEEMRAHLAELDESISAIDAMIEDDSSLDPIRVKAVFFSLYFGGE
ncbi:MAG: M23 family peptidase, partial [Oscillospiraceae bacterium]|nr:M23 family peptidase [Oscillospiraceae bacterium]